MNNFKKFFIFLFILATPFSAFASANLDLWKRNQFNYGPCGHCAPLLSFPGNKDRTDFREYSLQTRDGYFTINMSGPKGTAVTLFGQEGFATNNGYLVIVKEDDKDIEITDLEGFSPGKWTTVKDDYYGNYSAFYIPYQNFKSLIASIKWGKGPQSGTVK
ncbi:MAG: hypothetical protein HN472_13705 [Nitrospina sp.]|jgi:hypothetical protein|nr:hypothetical protein [Nitrospina sp.]MBT3874543.1 hypothetical protein [Nitrospina sp.]MBT4049854.1 hypothetical protein [Nitrospina sp.]MBT4557880.1 hypothetical protein [Nitrospina sp.]MBT5349473.1 hypothetical protein [Nitrospina sp.]